ncbi:hypothetical protein LTR37_017400 [Vermiconidia calcicola]|uniref:Uncharacterized protein n=1 Tax=Vermiconidia calcicola TaxID=1690605 RepID=A0ACC3ML45_9PEZI|nr:hypothetical protein LTR37_017400 [Vermiconidia calcicola]
MSGEKDAVMAREHVESNSSEHDKNRIQFVHVDGAVDYVSKDVVGGDVDQMPAGYYRSPRFIGTVIATCTASICAYLGWVLPANTLLLINEDIGPSLNLNWVATIWTLGSSIGFLLFGRLSDIFGRKEMVMGVNVLGLVGNIVGASASSIEQLIGANGCNGLAAAGQLSFGIILGELVPNKHRGAMATVVFISSLPFAVFGPVIARSFILTTSSGWRWSYYLGIILEVVTLVLYQFLYHPPRFDQLHDDKTRWQAFKELDFVGIFLFVSGFVVFLIGLSWGGSAYPWKSAEVVATTVIGGCLIIAFGIYEAYFCHTHPLMPPRMFKKIGFVAIVLCATVGSMVYYSMTVIWPTIIGTLYTTDTMAVGWKSCVVGGGVLLGQIIGGLSLSYVPKVKWQAIVTCVLGGAFVSSLASISAANQTAAIVQGLLGLIFIGIIENITFPGVTLLWEAQDIGLATGILGSIRGMGGAVAQALYVTILTNKSTAYIGSYVSVAATEAGLPESSLEAVFGGIATGSFAGIPGATAPVIAAVGGAVQRAYQDAFHMVFYATIPFSVILVIASLFVPNMEKFLHNDVARKLQTHHGHEKAPRDAEKA